VVAWLRHLGAVDEHGDDRAAGLQRGLDFNAHRIGAVPDPALAVGA